MLRKVVTIRHYLVILALAVVAIGATGANMLPMLPECCQDVAISSGRRHVIRNDSIWIPTPTFSVFLKVRNLPSCRLNQSHVC